MKEIFISWPILPTDIMTVEELTKPGFKSCLKLLPQVFGARGLKYIPIQLKNLGVELGDFLSIESPQGMY